MPAIGATATQKIVDILAGGTGLAFTVASVTAGESVALAPIDLTQVAAQNIAFDVAERTAGVTYPAVYVYCEGLSNQLKEKFRTFSGKAQMAAEVRVSYDSFDTLGRDLQLYASAVGDVLDSHRGDWGSGMFYAGGYQVDFGPIKRGGKNFLQTAKISFELDVSY